MRAGRSASVARSSASAGVSRIDAGSSADRRATRSAGSYAGIRAYTITMPDANQTTKIRQKTRPRYRWTTVSSEMALFTPGRIAEDRPLAKGRGGDEARLDVHPDAREPVEHTLDGRPDDRQRRDHLLRCRVGPDRLHRHEIARQGADVLLDARRVDREGPVGRHRDPPLVGEVVELPGDAAPVPRVQPEPDRAEHRRQVRRVHRLLVLLLERAAVHEEL